MALSDIYQKASLVQIPSGYKSGTLYSVVPSNGDGDFTIDSDADATRVNKDGLIETTVADQARLNYDPSNPQDPHLLLEPTRTNLITQSTELTSGALAKPDLTVSDNTSITDPQGGTDTKTLTATSTSQPRLEWRGTSVPASNTSYSMSFFVRYNTARYVAIAHFSQTGEYAIFDLVSGEVESDVGTQTAKIEAYPNGWYRVSKSFEVPSSASVNYWKFTLCTQTNAFVGVSGEKADVFGLQFEVGSYPTSLIPTAGSQVTRTADSALNLFNNATPTSYPFTVFVEMSIQTGKKGFGFSFLNRYTNYLYYSVGYCEGSANNKFRFTNRGDGNIYSVETTAQYFTGKHKIAVKFVSETNFKGFINGVEVVNLTHTASPFQTNNTSFLLGQLRTVTDTGDRNPIHQFMVFKEALTNAELITLTT